MIGHSVTVSLSLLSVFFHKLHLSLLLQPFLNPGYTSSVPILGDIHFGCADPDQYFENVFLSDPVEIVTCQPTGVFKKPDVWPQCISGEGLILSYLRKILCDFVPTFSYLLRSFPFPPFSLFPFDSLLILFPVIRFYAFSFFLSLSLSLSRSLSPSLSSD